MPFLRRFYQNQGLFVGPISGNASPITRVQSINDGWELNRQNVFQQGRQSALSREVVDAPTVNLSFSYYVTDGSDENKLGFVTDGVGSNSCLTNIMNGSSSERNFFISTSPEGTDLIGGSTFDVRGIGNAFVSSYSVEGSVGGFLTANVSVEASNANYSLGGASQPSVNPVNGQPLPGNVSLSAPITGTANQPTVLKRGDVTLDFTITNHLGATLTGVGGAHLQSFNLNIPLTRTVLTKLGNRYPYARPLTFPLEASLSFSALLNDITPGNLSSLFCSTNRYDIDIRANSTCGDASNEIVYSLRGATFDANSNASSVGSDTTTDLTFTVSIGAPNDTTSNIYILGSS